MKTGTTMSAIAAALAVCAALDANATYYSATASGTASLSSLSWKPSLPASLAAGDTLRLTCAADGTALSIDRALADAYLKFDVPDGQTLTATFDAAMTGAGSLAKLGAGTLVYDVAEGVENAYTGGTVVQQGTLKLAADAPTNLYVRTGATLDVNGQPCSGNKLYLSDRATLTNTGASHTSANGPHFNGGIELDAYAVVTIAVPTTSNNIGLLGEQNNGSSTSFTNVDVNLNYGMIVKTGAGRLETCNGTWSNGGTVRVEAGRFGTYQDGAYPLYMHTVTLDLFGDAEFYTNIRWSNSPVRIKNIIGTGKVNHAYGNRIRIFGKLDGRLDYSSGAHTTTFGQNTSATSTLDLSQTTAIFGFNSGSETFGVEGTLIIDVGERTFDTATQIVSWTTQPSSVTVTGLYVGSNYTVGSTGVTIEPMTVYTASVSGTQSESELTYSPAKPEDGFGATDEVVYTGAAGSALTLDSALGAGIVRVENEGAMTLTLGSSLDAAGAFAKSGAGTLTLAGSTGAETLSPLRGAAVDEGTLKLSVTNTAAISVASGATLDVNGKKCAAVTLADGATLTSSDNMASDLGAGDNYIDGINLAYCATGIVNCAKNINAVGTFDLNYGTLRKTGRGYFQLVRKNTGSIFSNFGRLRLEAGTMFTGGNGITAPGTALELANNAYFYKNATSTFKNLSGSGEVRQHDSNGTLTFNSGLSAALKATHRYQSPVWHVGAGSETVLTDSGENCAFASVNIGAESRWTFSGGTYGATNITAGADCELAVTGGTLNNAGAMTLGARTSLTVSAAGTQTGALTLSGACARLAVEGSGTVAFADSSAKTWSGALAVTTPGSGQCVRFGTSAAGLTETQLAAVTVNGRAAALDSNGWLVEQARGLAIIIK